MSKTTCRRLGWPVQGEGPRLDWPISLLRTGLSSFSGTGSRTELAFLPAPEQGPRLDWPVSLLRKRVFDWTGLPAIARRFQFFGSGLVLGSCFRVKNLPRFLHRFLEPVLEPSLVRFSVFYEESRFFLGIPNFCRYLSIFLDFLGLSGRFF